MGTRFLATPEAALHDAFKQAIVDSDGTDTIVTDVSDIMFGNDWPGAYSRVNRSRIIERWLGRPGELRRRRDEVIREVSDARKRGDAQESVVFWGQGAGLIHEIVPAAKVVADLVQEAEAIITERLPGLARRTAPAR